MNKKRKGFIMLWAIAAMAIASMLGAAVCLALSHVLERELDMEIHLDETWVAQDAMEREKYNTRFHGGEMSMPSTVERNGRNYEIHWQREITDIEGVSLIQITCKVSHPSGRTVSMVQLLENS